MENGLFDIPDYDNIEDESFAALPPPHSPGQGGTESGDLFANAEEDGDVSKLVDVPAAKRKGVKRPQPKLDSQRLISDRGLPALRTLFDNVRFKGKGHEAEDLRLLMQKMENWAHRLFPKLQFEDFIERVEKLGNKKEVQTCLKRIRLDMLLTHDDFTGGGEEASAAPESNIFGDPDPDPFSSFNDLHAPVHSTPAAPAAPPAPPAASPTSPSLTEEQRRRMELNRQRALERRIARQQQQQTDPSESQTTETPADQPPSVLNVSENQDQDIESVDLDSKVQAQEVDPVDLDSKDQDMEPVDLVSKDQVQEVDPVDLDSKDQAQEVDPVDLDSKDQAQEVDPVDLDSKDQAQEVDPVDLDSKDQDQEVDPVNLDSKDQDQDIRAVDLDPPGSTQVLSSPPQTDSDPPAGPPESQQEDPGPPRSSSQCEDGD